MQNHKKYKIVFILVVIIIILLSFTLFLYIKAPIFFKPNHKVIQYQEEVKLSNGEMIWVDIKRHYRLTGGAPGDGSMLTGHYLPSIVEISWDTGFEGVGRRSVFFYNGVIFIDKIDNVWYVLGGRPSYNGAYNGIDAINCRDVGIPIEKGPCLYVLGADGKNLSSIEAPNDFIQSIHVNFLTLTGLYDWVHNTNNLDGVGLTWSDKVRIDTTIKDKSWQSLGLPYSSF